MLAKEAVQDERPCCAFSRRVEFVQRQQRGKRCKRYHLEFTTADPYWRITVKGYWIILGTDVTDQAAQQEYGRLWAPIGEKYGATVRVLDPEVLVESRSSRRVLAVEFPSYEQAKACYKDPAYTHAKEFALRASQRELIIIEGDLA
ncbi:DUF1330 domain-containing protein [Aromatoleum toluvorans]|uniref:DUF1330 domain-containing protein n=1 Tax=Aromatoleum toluvorans TaxID=92002 RepID=UPI001B7CF110|nr:DUF1330 domain-containing protein [Aromatoleum toluvorans]